MSYHLIDIVEFPNEWKMHSGHKALILTYASAAFKVPEKEFLWFQDCYDNCHLMVDRSNLKDASDEQIKNTSTYIDGFVWGLSYAKLKKVQHDIR